MSSSSYVGQVVRYRRVGETVLTQSVIVEVFSEQRTARLENGDLMRTDPALYPAGDPAEDATSA